MIRRAAVGLLALAVVLLGACRRVSPPMLAPSALTATRHFKVLPVYWVGMRFDGVPLTAADRPADYDPSLGMRVYYGDCLRHRSPLGSGGCTLPLEITSVLLKVHSNQPLGVHHATHRRGVPAVIFDHGRSIELYTGRVAIDIFATTARRAERAVRALRTLNTRPSYRSGPLPPPDYSLVPWD
ncbi:MAG TPA: hypothetical protein VGN69_05465 [Solirubrobacteraceae bacterium]|jgi:hypothetical protein|nr:hypothetical protein [Solirubrobacteraceae bacterium]